jgi:hypothetical protein
MPTLTLFLDESGYTGPDLINREQPFFTLASTNIAEADARSLLTSCFGERTREVKFLKLAKSGRGRSQIVEFVRALDPVPSEPRDWLGLPVMRRIAISTPNVMTALRNLNRDQARPYNFALSPVLTSLSGQRTLLLGPFVKNARRWETMPYVNIYDGQIHTINPPTLLALPHTFELMFAQYWRHPEFKSLAPDGSPCKGDTRGLLKRCPVTAAGLHFIGKETERGWEQDDDISTLLPSLVRYDNSGAIAGTRLQDKLLRVSIDTLQVKTGLSRNTILRARRGQRIHTRSALLLARAIVGRRTVAH